MLEHLLHPETPPEFFSIYWERKPLHVRAEDGARFKDYLSFADLDRLLAVLPDNRYLFVINNTEDDSKGQEFLAKDAKEPLTSLYERFYLGDTLLINGLDTTWEPVSRLSRQLIAALGCFVNVNAYITPAEARGFKPHWDDHDVFVLQTDGEKEWHLFEGGPLLPRRFEGHGLESGSQAVADPGEPSLVLRMRPGDLLYIPRGTIHQAVTTDSASMHLTAGLYHKTWEDLAIAAVRRAAERHPELRRALPVKSLGPGEPPPGLGQPMRHALDMALSDMDPAAAALLLKLEMIDRLHPLPAGHFAQVIASDDIGEDTLVERLPDMVFEAGLEGGATQLTFPGNHLTWPGKMSWALSFLEKTERFKVADIPGWYSLDEKVVLVRHLIRKGFLRTVSRP